MTGYAHVYEITVRVHSDSGELTDDEQAELVALIDTEDLNFFAADRSGTVIEVHGPQAVIPA